MIVPLIATLIGLIPQLPSLAATVEGFIARGKATGELTPAEADALTLLAQGTFAKYSSPAPPPPGA